MNVELIVRSNWNRKINLQSGASTQLFTFVDGLPEAARFSVTIPAAPGRKERTAELASALLARDVVQAASKPCP